MQPEACEHSNVGRGANQHAAWTKCKDCGKRLSYVEKKTGETTHFVGYTDNGTSVSWCDQMPEASADLNLSFNGTSVSWYDSFMCCRKRRHTDEVTHFVGYTGTATFYVRFKQWLQNRRHSKSKSNNPVAAPEDVDKVIEVPTTCSAEREVEGKIIMDTECRRSVPNRKWHKQLRALCAKEGLKPISRPIKERFTYGGGASERSDRAWLYPIGVYGKSASLDIAEVNGPCPPLLSNRAMKDMGAVLNYDEESMDLRKAGIYGKPMTELSSGHPVLDITQWGTDKFPDEFLTYYLDSVAIEDYEIEVKPPVIKRGAMKRLKRVSGTLQEVYGSACEEQSAMRKYRRPQRPKGT